MFAFGLFTLLPLVWLACAGAGVIWIILKWWRRPVGWMDLARGAGSWVAAALLAFFVRGLIGMGGAGAVLGTIGGVLTCWSIRWAAGVPVRSATVAASSATWCVGFSLTDILNILTGASAYGIGYIMSAPVIIGLWIVAGAAGSAVLVQRIAKDGRDSLR
jgi:hypothetical protein